MGNNNNNLFPFLLGLVGGYVAFTANGQEQNIASKAIKNALNLPELPKIKNLPALTAENKISDKTIEDKNKNTLNRQNERQKIEVDAKNG